MLAKVLLKLDSIKASTRRAVRESDCKREGREMYVWVVLRNEMERESKIRASVEYERWC